MPVISMFYGLIVSMYYLDTKQHKLPHIHVKYGENEGVYQIPEGILLEGNLPWNDFIDFDPDTLYLEGKELVRLYRSAGSIFVILWRL